MDAIKNAATSASETIQQGVSGTSKEANKQVAKDSDASLTDRATAGKDALSDKASEEKHAAKK
ncbi:putative glucose repressible protein Grg1 [Mytilinidion resinicola]|uniref:Glucose repressible protein Grg1 n=1 Tax=Mytilinidion resinicola TaxID=574789 RepID=A0A6A6Y7E4_9PEZI|nr:putative glucose repressible protein Grg1 [Mytilinidion resinicola]KAF2804761.1 putative glucose repressible protein Grg1 [Mytilinidion resinicola]